MSVSSLQRRIRGGSGSTSKVKASGGSFENCFSSGLDFSEFTLESSNQTSSSSELLIIKAQAAAKSRMEEKAEADVEKRIATVNAAKSQEKTNSNDDINLRAANPHSNLCHGSDRDNNFLQFDTGNNSSDNGFLTSLVQNHNSERKEMGMSHRALSSKSRAVAGANADKRKMLSSQLARGSSKRCALVKSGSKKVSAKKVTKSKF